MRHLHWIIDQAMSHKRQAERELLLARAKMVISNRMTQRKQLSDFPDVDAYLKGKFPDVDLSEVSFYMSPHQVIEDAGFKGMGGCYLRDINTIFVKNKIDIASKPKTKFQRIFYKACDGSVDVEDVVVHEFIHAVSSKIGRSLSKYTHVEEEFVYTNCIDFYKKKGLTEDEIVDNNFLPFCLNDIYSSAKDMTEIISKMGYTLDEIRKLSDSEYLKWADSHAKELVSLLKEKAQEKAHHMIELYKKYGNMYKMSASEPPENFSAARFSALELD